MERNIEKEVLSIVDEALCLNGRSREFVLATPLLGAVPELDSMAVLAVLSLLEERFGITIDDDEIDGSAFATLGSLVHFVAGKLAPV